MSTAEIDNRNQSDEGHRTTAKIRDRASAARTRASDAYAAARERTSAAYDSTREGLSRAGQKTADGLESNPMAALVGGLALGALVAMFLPRSERESRMIGTYGRRINEKAREAARAAREIGSERLGEIAGQAGEAVKSSADAAAKAAKSKRR